MESITRHRLLPARDFQHRHQLDAVCDWWRRGGVGVSALIGIGGAGKTSLAEAFLRLLPGGLPEQRGTPKLPDLRRPDGVCVFSFQAAPDPDAFFRELYRWVHGEAPDDEAGAPSYQRLIQEVADTGHRGLLVLDGLERVQDSGAQGGRYGQILDSRLRDFVMRVADGWLPRLSVLITSRFSLVDPLEADSWHYWPIGVDGLDPEAAVSLLRARGARGTDRELEKLASAQGFHALTVDLMGGYVGRFCDGDPARLEEPDAPTEAPDPAPAHRSLHEHRFGRVARRYAEALWRSDPAALALLERACVFRPGLSEQKLARVFLGEHKDEVSGQALGRLSRLEIRAKLELLTELRLLHRQGDSYTPHPAVREAFAIDRGVAASLSDAIQRAQRASLLAEPDYPADSLVLDQLEQIVHHTLAAGHVADAWEIYRNRMGGFWHLGHRLGAYERGERLCRAFVGGRPAEQAPVPEELSSREQAHFINEWALCLEHLGRLDPAAVCYARTIELLVRRQDWHNASISDRNLADMLVKAGRLGPALGAAEGALCYADRAQEVQDRQHSLPYRALVRGLRGEPTEALADFEWALGLQHEIEGVERPLWTLGGIYYADLLIRLGWLDEAEQSCKANVQILRERLGSDDNRFVPQCRLLLADIARKRRDLAAARSELTAAHEWALARDDTHLLCWAALVRARIERDAGDLHAARVSVDQGLHIARRCGFGLHHIDLLLVRAELEIRSRDSGAARRTLQLALYDGLEAEPAFGFSEMVAATDPECGYYWAIEAGRKLLDQTLPRYAAPRRRRVTVTTTPPN